MKSRILSFGRHREPIWNSISSLKLGFFKAIGRLPVVSKRFRVVISFLRFLLSSLSVLTLDRSCDTWFRKVSVVSSFFWIWYFDIDFAVIGELFSDMRSGYHTFSTLGKYYITLTEKP